MQSSFECDGARGVKTIGSWAFSYCTSLVSISIPNSVSMMGYDILSGSSGNMVCNANSYAYEYAIRHGYIKVGQQPPIQRSGCHSADSHPGYSFRKRTESECVRRKLCKPGRWKGGICVPRQTKRQRLQQ